MESLLLSLAGILTDPFFICGLFFSGILLHKFFHRKEKLAVLFGFLVLVILTSGALSILLKGHFSFERPCAGKAIDCPGDYSFPSSHAMVSFAVFSFLFFLNGRWQASELILAFPFIISLSRVIQGVHTVADISAGALLGTIIGGIYARIHVFNHSLSEKVFRRANTPAQRPHKK
ncbi:MAG: phosphatase PAP2 family protein [archaeon]